MNAPQDGSGLVMMGARFYDPGVAGFVSVDPKLDPDVPAQFHAYVYSGNNPLTWSDPSGEAWLLEGSGSSNGTVAGSAKSVRHRAKQPNKTVRSMLPCVLTNWTCRGIENDAAVDAAIKLGYDKLGDWMRSADAQTIRSVGNANGLLLNEQISHAASYNLIAIGFNASTSYEGGQVTAAMYVMYENFKTNSTWDLKPILNNRFGLEGKLVDLGASGRTLRSDTLGNVNYGVMMHEFGVEMSAAIKISNLQVAGVGESDPADDFAIEVGYALAERHAASLTLDEYASFIERIMG